LNFSLIDFFCPVRQNGIFAMHRGMMEDAESRSADSCSATRKRAILRHAPLRNVPASLSP